MADANNQINISEEDLIALRHKLEVLVAGACHGHFTGEGATFPPPPYRKFWEEKAKDAAVVQAVISLFLNGMQPGYVLSVTTDALTSGMDVGKLMWTLEDGADD